MSAPTTPEKRKVVLCVPTMTRPFQQCLDAMEASVPLIEAAGIEALAVWEVGCPYISHARANMLRKAMDAKADVVVFIDHDLSWEPGDLLKLIDTPGDVVAGTYRFKMADESYMGAIYTDPEGRPEPPRVDGCIRADLVPAGFLKVTKEAVHKFMVAYPELCFGFRYNLAIDLFNHGARDGVWWGEDYAFSRRWRECGGDIWLVPDLNLTHHSADTAYPGNYHQHLMRCPGGVLDPAREVP